MPRKPYSRNPFQALQTHCHRFAAHIPGQSRHFMVSRDTTADVGHLLLDQRRELFILMLIERLLLDPGDAAAVGADRLNLIGRILDDGAAGR